MIVLYIKLGRTKYITSIEWACYKSALISSNNLHRLDCANGLWRWFHSKTELEQSYNNNNNNNINTDRCRLRGRRRALAESSARAFD